MLSDRVKKLWSGLGSSTRGAPCLASSAPKFDRSYPVSHKLCTGTFGSGRASISNCSWATVRGSGTTGRSTKYDDPDTAPPPSSLPNSANTSVRFGRGPAASASANAITATVPDASSSAPLKILSSPWVFSRMPR